MLVYHGSDSNFKNLRISKSLVKHQSTLENEGLGIYFSTDREVARSYGKYIYSLYVNDSYLLDFRKKSVCVSYMTKIIGYVRAKSGIDIRRIIDVNPTISRMYLGGTAISRVGQELKLVLDSSEYFWCGLNEKQRGAIIKALGYCDRHCPVAYLFNYSIKNTGIVKSVDENVVIIYKKENSY